jgi:NADH:ubiquinone oxidoreductase subunit F (NADH-binding)
MDDYVQAFIVTAIIPFFLASMDFDGLKALGSSLGTGAVIVLDKQSDVVRSIARFSKVRLP